MVLIAHRGNVDGPNPEKENHPDYIDAAVQRGYAVEVDLWRVEDSFFLGHDEPQYRISEKYLDLLATDSVLWTHIKNIQALEYLAKNERGKWNYFWHQEDDYALTSLGHIWALPGSKLTPNTICVMPEKASYYEDEILNSQGVCSDYVSIWRDNG